MSLRELAATDNRTILEDTEGFGWSVTLTDPDGFVADVFGFTNDISQVIDPQTGMAVTGREASVVFSIAGLTEAGFGMPRGIADGALKPWTARFLDPNGNEHLFKILEAKPDRGLGCVACTLEAYKLIPV